MSSTWTLSERELADHACDSESERVLIGGLGLGFSLKRVLELIGTSGEAVVAELLPEVVAWNREFLSDLTGPLLNDPRTELYQGDVYDRIRKAADGKERPWDAILLDTDNGPTSLVQPGNKQMYSRNGFEMIRRALVPGGRVAFWAAGEEPGFEKKLRKNGFRAERITIKAHERAKKAIHRIYVGERPL